MNAASHVIKPNRVQGGDALSSLQLNGSDVLVWFYLSEELCPPMCFTVSRRIAKCAAAGLASELTD